MEKVLVSMLVGTLILPDVLSHPGTRLGVQITGITLADLILHARIKKAIELTEKELENLN